MGEEVRKERDELRQVVAKSQDQLDHQIAEARAETRAATKAEMTTAANAAFKEEMEKRAEEQRQKESRSNAAIEDARRTTANAQAIAHHAREQAQKANEKLAAAEMRIHLL